MSRVCGSHRASARHAVAAVGIVAGLAVGLVPSAEAGVNIWSPIGPSSETVEQIALGVTSPSSAYLAGGSGIYRTTDAGTSWHLVTNQLFTGRHRIAVDPTDVNRIFVTTIGDRMYSSSDGGVTIAPHASFPFPNGDAQVAAFSPDGSALYVVAGVNFYRSVDHGATWQLRGTLSGVSGGYAVNVLIDRADPATILIHRTENTAFVSHDGGSTWQPMQLPAQFSQQLAFTQQGPQRLWAATHLGLFVSSDLGAHWSPTTLTEPVLSVATHPADAAVLLVGDAFGRIWRSNDEAAHWSDVTGAARLGQIYAVEISKADPQRMFVGGLEGVWGSTDAAATWVRRSEGLTGASVSGMSAAAASDRIYVSLASGGIHRLAGGETTFVPVDDAAFRQNFPFPFSVGLRTLLAQGLEPDRLLAATPSLGLLRSTDAGSSWSQIGTGAFGDNEVFRLADSPLNEDLILAGGLVGIFRSVNGGIAWSPVSGMPSESRVRDVVMGPSTAYTAIMTPTATAYDGRGVYKSSDQGSSWVSANTGIASTMVHSLAVDPSNDHIVYAGSEAGLLRTMDAGAQWTHLPWIDQNATYEVAIDPVHPTILFAAVGNAVGRSIDRGDTWEQLHTLNERPLWSASALLVDPQHPGTFLVGTHTHGIQHIIIAPDLSLQASGPAAASGVGTRLNYRFTLRNLGPYHATHPRLEIHVPASASNITTTVTGATGSCTDAAPVVTCSFTALRAGFSAQIDFGFLPAAGTVIVTANGIGR
jgi:photosystem II stability/assembly factor-like uncharacterized protein